MLDSLGYHDRREFTVSLETDDVTIRDSLTSVSAYVDRAEEKHDRGDYPGAMVDCRNAIEVLLDLSDKLDGKMDKTKQDGLESVLGNMKGGVLGGFAHPGETTDIDTPLRRDSDFALGVTKTCLRYVSTVFEEQD
jgi:hypothetical protein